LARVPGATRRFVGGAPNYSRGIILGARRLSRVRISRNARLAARIADLEAEGWKFETKKVGGDFVYNVTAKPAPKQLKLV
jgi:hypothetical protein